MTESDGLTNGWRERLMDMRIDVENRATDRDGQRTQSIQVKILPAPTHNHGLGQTGILFQKLNNTISELRVIDTK